MPDRDKVHPPDALAGHVGVAVEREGTAARGAHAQHVRRLVRPQPGRRAHAPPRQRLRAQQQAAARQHVGHTARQPELPCEARAPAKSTSPSEMQAHQSLEWTPIRRAHVVMLSAWYRSI